MTVTKDTMLYEVLAMDESTAELFMEIGMHCLSCPASMFETVGEACMVHGVDADDFLEHLNEYLGNSEAES